VKTLCYYNIVSHLICKKNQVISSIRSIFNWFLKIFLQNELSNSMKKNRQQNAICTFLVFMASGKTVKYLLTRFAEQGDNLVLWICQVDRACKLTLYFRIFEKWIVLTLIYTLKFIVVLQLFKYWKFGLKKNHLNFWCEKERLNINLPLITIRIFLSL
jgi:hypothetical protein